MVGTEMSDILGDYFSELISRLIHQKVGCEKLSHDSLIEPFWVIYQHFVQGIAEQVDLPGRCLQHNPDFLSGVVAQNSVGRYKVLTPPHRLS